jgi:hypothetical protein
MDNLARIIAVAISGSNNQLTPCIKVLFGAYVGAQQGASFAVNLSFTYTSGGTHVGPVLSNQPVSRLTFVQGLDAYFTRARAQPVSLPSMPDTGTPVVCTATLQISNSEGQLVDCGPADITTFYPTIGR